MGAEFPEKVKPVTPLKQLEEHSVIVENGEEYNIDSILLCTGYKYSFPFLPERYQPMTSEDEQFQRLSRLYKMTVHVDDPTLLFVGMTKYAANFHFYHLQSQFAAAVVLGKCSLPDKPAKVADVERDFEHKRKMGIPPTHYHYFVPMSYFVKTFQDSILQMTEPGWIVPISEKLLHFWDTYLHAVAARPYDFRFRTYPRNIDWESVPKIEFTKLNWDFWTKYDSIYRSSAKHLGPVSQKILNPLVILSMEKTMVTMVISELKSISRLKIFRETEPWYNNIMNIASLEALPYKYNIKYYYTLYYIISI